MAVASHPAPYISIIPVVHAVSVNPFTETSNNEMLLISI